MEVLMNKIANNDDNVNWQYCLYQQGGTRAEMKRTGGTLEKPS